MDAAQALADLTEISSQIVHVAIVDGDGAVLASSLEDDARAARFAEGASSLLRDADAARLARGLIGLAQLEAATFEGSVFIVLGSALGSGGSGYIAAVTRPEPTVGLVFYDLKHCLRSVVTKSPARGSGRGKATKAPPRKKADASA